MCLYCVRVCVFVCVCVCLSLITSGNSVSLAGEFVNQSINWILKYKIQIQEREGENREQKRRRKSKSISKTNKPASKKKTEYKETFVYCV